MKNRIGITQRTSLRNNQKEIYDSYDQLWVNFAEQCDLLPVFIPNLISDPISYFEELNFSGIILTGGGGFSEYIEGDLKNFKKNFIDRNLISKERDILEFKLIKYCSKKSIPLIGICRGMQTLNYFYEGYLEDVEGHSGKIVEMKNLINDYKYDKFVNSFHEKGITHKSISKEFNILAISNEVIKAFKHKNLPLYGIMWHPERNSPFSKNDLIFFQNIFNKI